jgi:hypothetical protein
MKITSAHDAGVGERRGCFMKRVMAFIICIMFGRTLLPRLRRCPADQDRFAPLRSIFAPLTGGRNDIYPLKAASRG